MTVILVCFAKPTSLQPTTNFAEQTANLKPYKLGKLQQKEDNKLNLSLILEYLHPKQSQN